jgi:hypothetical protein
VSERLISVKAATMALTARQLVVVGNVVQLQRCDLYAHWSGMLDAHHVIPHSWWLAADKPVETPLRDLCPNCHYDTHVAIDSLLAGRDVHLLPPRCVALAKAAIAGAESNGLTPRPTL